MTIYKRAIGALRREGLISTNDSVLVVCGGDYDKNSLAEMGFTDVIVSNLDRRYADRCQPFGWQYLDAENIAAPDRSFD
jgi:hypothetical protein